MTTDPNMQAEPQPVHGIQLDSLTGSPLERPQSDQDNLNLDASTSLGASINESLMMPAETLSNHPSGLGEPALPIETSTLERQEGRGQLSRIITQKILQNPYACIAAAAGLGFILGKYATNATSKPMNR